MMFDRRDFLVGAGGAATALLVGVPGGGAEARAPMSGAQVPGFYRFPLGHFQITVVSDGTISFPCEALWPESC